MENKNINVSTNSTNETNATSVINGGGKMNNKFKQAREAEQVAKQEAKKAADRQARLDAIEPIDVVETIDEVVSKEARTYRDENGNSLGTNGDKLYQKPITIDGKSTTIAAESLEALEALDEAIKNGLSGDGKFHKTLCIGGMMCDCVGATPEELEADIAAAEDYAKKHSKGSILRDIDTAEQLVDAGYSKEELEQVEGKDGSRYLISYGEKRIMAESGETIVSLEDLSSELSRADMKTLLVERLNNYIDEHICDDCEEDCDDDEYDDYEYPCDNEDEDDPCDYCRYYDDCQNPNKTRY